MSDTAAPRTAASRAARHRAASDSLPVLLLAASPLVFWLLSGSVSAIFAAIFHFALLALAAVLIADGHDAAVDYHSAAVASRPRLPKKIMGSAVLGLVVFLLAAGQFHDLLPPLFFGFAALGFSVAAFGIDPLRDKGLDSQAWRDRCAADRLLTRTDAALRDVVDRVAAHGEGDLTLRAEAMHGAVMRLLRTFATDPQRLFALSAPLDKFLSLAEAECARLEGAWRDDPVRAGSSFAARLSALTAAFEAGARARRQAETPDTYALDADLLADRIRRRSQR